MFTEANELIIATWDKFLKTYPYGRSLAIKHAHQLPQDLWNSCERDDWMFWILREKCGIAGYPDHKTFVKIACARAKWAFAKYLTENDQLPLQAIEAAEAWIEEPTELNRQKCCMTSVKANISADWAKTVGAKGACYAATYAATCATLLQEPNKPGKQRRRAQRVETKATNLGSDRKDQANLIRALWPKIG